jgi:hypothetical protein
VCEVRDERCCICSANTFTWIVVAGSANINMRSLAGTRDTEIAACVWQPNHMRQLMYGHVAMPRRQIHGFRMSLWKEHLGNVTPEMDEVLRDPGSLACSRLIQQCAQVCSLTHPSTFSPADKWAAPLCWNDVWTIHTRHSACSGRSFITLWSRLPCLCVRRASMLSGSHTL